MEVEEVEKYRKMYKEGLLAEIKGLIIGGVIGLIFGIMGVASGDFYWLFTENRRHFTRRSFN